MTRRSTQKRDRARGQVLRCLLNEDFSAPGFLPAVAELLLDCSWASHHHPLLSRLRGARSVLFASHRELDDIEIPVTVVQDGKAVARAVHDAAKKGGGES